MKISHQTPTQHASSISEWRISKMGYEFDINNNSWKLDGSIKVNWSTFPQFENEVSVGFRLALCRWAEEQSARYTATIFSFFKKYWEKHQDYSITVTGLSNHKAYFGEKNQHKLGVARSFIYSWYEWGFPGISDDVITYLEELTLQGNVKGKAVKSRCPYTGPLTMQEQAALLDWVSNAFNNQQITLTEYAIFLTLMFTGRRLIQIRYLRACDLVVKESDTGNEYVIKFPRVKQPSGFRREFRPVSVTEDLFLLLQNHIVASQKTIRNRIGGSLPNKIRQQVPIFINKRQIARISDLDDLISVIKQQPDYLHMTHREGSNAIHRLSIKNYAKSERTGEFIIFTSRRFRYTKATNLARRGISGVALAYALDHTDTQHIDVYTKNTPDAARQIDDVMAQALSPLAQAFAGKLITSEREAVHENDPHSRVKNGTSHKIGSCGSYAFCASGYRACYTCVNFQPWLDAPHHEVRQEILVERQYQKEHDISPYVIQSTDRLLLAVQQVIDLCEKSKHEMNFEPPHG